MVRASSRTRGSPADSAISSAYPSTAVNGLFNACATPPASCPKPASFSARTSRSAIASFPISAAIRPASDSMAPIAFPRRPHSSVCIIASNSAPSAHTTIAPASLAPSPARTGVAIPLRRRRRSFLPLSAHDPTSRSNSLHGPSSIAKLPPANPAPASRFTSTPATSAPNSAPSLPPRSCSSSLPPQTCMARKVRSSTPTLPTQANRPSASRSSSATRVKTLLSAMARHTRLPRARAASTALPLVPGPAPARVRPESDTSSPAYASSSSRIVRSRPASQFRSRACRCHRRPAQAIPAMPIRQTQCPVQTSRAISMPISSPESLSTLTRV